MCRPGGGEIFHSSPSASRTGRLPPGELAKAGPQALSEGREVGADLTLRGAHCSKRQEPWQGSLFPLDPTGGGSLADRVWSMPPPSDGARGAGPAQLLR